MASVVRLILPRVWPQAWACPSAVVVLTWLRSKAFFAVAWPPAWQLAQLAESCGFAFVVKPATLVQPPASGPPPVAMPGLMTLKFSDAWQVAPAPTRTTEPPPSGPVVFGFVVWSRP